MGLTDGWKARGTLHLAQPTEPLTGKVAMRAGWMTAGSQQAAL